MYMNESDGVMNSKFDVNSIHSQRDPIEALHNLSPTLAVSRSTVLAPLAAITEIKGWTLEDDSATEAMHKTLGARLRYTCRHVSQAVSFFGCVSKLLVLFWFPHIMQSQPSKRSLTDGAMNPSHVTMQRP